MRNLYERLRQQREAEPATVPAAGRRPTGATVRRRPHRYPDLAPPWRQVSDQVWRAVYRTPAVAAGVLRRSAALGGLLIGPETDPEGLCFFDTETTGLSGGAGTTVFLVATGRLDGNELETTLLLLADFCGEPAFLQLVRDQLQQAQTLVSYNGRAFDSNILRNRFLLNRIEPVEFPHIDLLHPSRRLFGSLIERCSLGVVERELLGVKREIDIEGAAIPETWLRFLKDRKTGEMQRVFVHVHQDVASLVELLARIEQLAAGQSDDGLVDRFQRARLLIESPYRRLAGVPLRRSGLQSLEAMANDLDHPQTLPAARYYCGLQRRSGNWDAAHAVWRVHFEHRRSVWAAIELAKYYEHRRRDYRAAAETVARARTWVHAAEREELAKRWLRIELKRGRAQLRSAGKGRAVD